MYVSSNVGTLSHVPVYFLACRSGGGVGCGGGVSWGTPSTPQEGSANGLCVMQTSSSF